MTLETAGFLPINVTPDDLIYIKTHVAKKWLEFIIWKKDQMNAVYEFITSFNILLNAYLMLVNI